MTRQDSGKSGQKSSRTTIASIAPTMPAILQLGLWICCTVEAIAMPFNHAFSKKNE